MCSPSLLPNSLGLMAQTRWHMLPSCPTSPPPPWLMLSPTQSTATYASLLPSTYSVHPLLPNLLQFTLSPAQPPVTHVWLLPSTCSLHPLSPNPCNTCFPPAQSPGAHATLLSNPHLPPQLPTLLPASCLPSAHNSPHPTPHPNSYFTYPARPAASTIPAGLQSSCKLAGIGCLPPPSSPEILKSRKEGREKVSVAIFLSTFPPAWRALKPCWFALEGVFWPSERSGDLSWLVLEDRITPKWGDLVQFRALLSRVACP